MSNLPWFRMYSEAVDDEKLRLLAFEDRWHFVALLCCKSKGILDEQVSEEMLRRKVAVKLGLDLRALDEAGRRLAEVGLIDKDTLQPLAWGDRQFLSDSSTERVRAYRERSKRSRNVPETAQETDTETDTETEVEKNKKQVKPRAFDALAYLVSVGVPEGVANDWLTIRKAKKTPLTMTAIKGLEREAEKAGVSIMKAVEYCCEAGWAGFNAGWYADRQAKQPAQGGNKGGNGGKVAGLSGVI